MSVIRSADLLAPKQVRTLTFVMESAARSPVRWAEFDRLIARKGWNAAEAARQIGISHAYLTNLRAGRTGVGEKFITGCVQIWGPQVTHEVLLDGPEAGAA